MTAPRTSVHPSGTRRRTPARSRRSTPVRRRRTTGTPNRRRPAGKRKGRRRSPSLQRWWPALLVAAAILVGLAWDTESRGVPRVPGRCTLVGTDLTLTQEQLTNARTIAGVAQERGLPERAVVIALATAQQESRLRNLDYGDRDSLGLFQQRPSQGWGSEAQVRDPVYAAGKFYDGLVEVPDWQTGRLTEVSQSVQRSGFPEAYQQWEPMAQAWTTALLSGRDGYVACTPE
ncbi:hypothetical protein [Blastococcus sp. CT_GayMR20]|uniref:hypothetical protein n=1 Tax=Blastococcus sp. CT_GayMR20 TaxID=2559609 RepID=UPI0014318C43|nr:hypothetical protein [Blastococcus sp. CT_GayMR20]